MIVDLPTCPRDEGGNGGLLLYLSEAGGLTQFGAYLDRLAPGAVSSERHWHTAEDEFLLMLEGEAVLVDDNGPQDLHPGDAVCWRHGAPNAHHIQNRSDKPVSYLIVGSRVAGDICHYPDSGTRQINRATGWTIEDDQGRVLRGGDLPKVLQGLAGNWGKPYDGRPMPNVIRKGSVKGFDGVGYPAEFATLGPYMAYPLSDEGGLTQFGAFTETLAPGSQSTQRHWHEDEDEFLYVLEGEVTVVEDDGPHILRPGQAACWPKGVANGHCLRNDSGGPVLYFVVGTRMPNDRCHYPDIDLAYSRQNGVRMMARKDGTPYPGWPKGPKT